MLKQLSFLFLFSFFIIKPVSAETAPFYHQGRLFKLTIPSTNQQKKPLLLLLHGCKQNAETIINGTGLNHEAIKRQFYLLVPEQSATMNSDRCWNWFFSEQQDRGNFTEMMSLIQAIKSLSQHYPIDSSRIFVAGMSAGGAMAHNLLACFPDYFAGGAIHSGLAFKTAENIYEAQTVTTSTAQKNPEYLGSRMFECRQPAAENLKLKKILIIHGLEDSRVSPLHADLISSTHEELNALMGDEALQVHEELQSFENGYQAFITDKAYRTFSERKILIKGLKHAWGGGQSISENFDPKAPSSNQYILNYFNL